MITQYYRPQTLNEALKLLEMPGIRPLGGGTWFNQHREETCAVVDLQLLGLNQIQSVGNTLKIGASATLQDLFLAKNCPESLRQALRLEAALNIRNAATVAGTLVTGSGRSAFATCLLAMDAQLEFAAGVDPVRLGEFLPVRQPGLMTSISISLEMKSAFESVGRSPMDTPIVCACVARWGGKRTRLALGGFGPNPLLAMDGTEAEGIEHAARNAFHEAGDDWASAEYRANTAAALSQRCLEAL